jgi:hypothetical protein
MIQGLLKNVIAMPEMTLMFDFWDFAMREASKDTMEAWIGVKYGGE